MRRNIKRPVFFLLSVLSYATFSFSSVVMAQDEEAADSRVMVSEADPVLPNKLSPANLNSAEGATAPGCATCHASAVSLHAVTKASADVESNSKEDSTKH